MIVEIHLLLVAYWVLGDPETLRVTFELYVEESDWKNDGDGECRHDDDAPVVVVEPPYFLEN